MRFAFDLDGTLDRKVMRDLAKILLDAGHEVHIITGIFAEAGDWQDVDAKRLKLQRLGIPFTEDGKLLFGHALLHILVAVDVSFSREYRLNDLGLRKGALCEQLGISIFIDDSSTYCEMVPKMSGDTLVLKVG
jgi:hypothetical protein